MKLCTNMYLDNLWNIKVIRQRSRSHWFLCVFLACMILLEPCSWPEFTKCHSLDGATSLLPADAPCRFCVMCFVQTSMNVRRRAESVPTVAASTSWEATSVCVTRASNPRLRRLPAKVLLNTSLHTHDLHLLLTA